MSAPSRQGGAPPRDSSAPEPLVTEAAGSRVGSPRPQGERARPLGGRGSLTVRTAVAGAVLAAIVGSAFLVLVLAIDEQRSSAREARETREELGVVDRLEQLVIDLETGLRGFVITGEERFLQPWSEARAALPAASESLERLVADDPAARSSVQAIVAAADAYVEQYALPLLAAAERRDASARSVARTEEGKRRVDALRAQFETLRARERSEITARQERADNAASRAVVAGLAGLTGSIVLILLFTAYFGRAIARPVRRTAGMARRLAEGDLSARTPETGVAEIGVLERSFNTMGTSLERSRRELKRLLEEQAALRRVATLVARGMPAGELLAAVAEEIAQLLGAEITKVLRYEADGTATVLGGWSVPRMHVPVGTRLTLEGTGVAEAVLRTPRPVRTSGFEGPPGSVADCFRGVGAHWGVGSPILVEGRLWGVAIAASSEPKPLPAESEGRIANFTELVATAIANAEARVELHRVADEQAALRRVATLVAQAVPSSDVFEAVTREVGLLSGADLARMERYETDMTVTGVAAWSKEERTLAVGSRIALEGVSIAALVQDAGRPVRVDSFADASGPIAEEARALGIRSSVGCPVVVAGRLWGVIAASSKGEEPFPADTESQIGKFTELVATAIANAESRAELTASRARIVAAGDEARRRIERDLHDGAQQRLVSLALALRAAQQTVPPDLDELRDELSQTADGLQAVLAELQEISRGIHPAILSAGGLGPALRTLARRSAVPVELDVRAETRLPERVEVAAYYVVSEALTNVAKHAAASAARVAVESGDGVVRIEVRDDGTGGADPARGSGLIGLVDRVEALGGTIEIESPRRGGTSLRVTLPVAED